MNLIRFADTLRVQFVKSSGGSVLTFEANRDYVFARAQIDRIMRDEDMSKRIFKVSLLDSRVPAFHVQAKKIGTQRLLLYNGGGGFGDQIMTWPLARLLAQMGYDVHILTEPGNDVCWYHFPFVKSLNFLPMAYEHWKMYDYHLVCEAAVNQDEHQDQEHPLDVMLRRIGIDPKSVDPALKSVRPAFTLNEILLARQKQANRKVGIYQLASANPVRSLPPNDSAFILVKLAQEFPDIHWFALFDKFNSEDYPKAIEAKIKELDLTNVETWNSNMLRDLWALTDSTSVVVAPDSMMVHIAGSMDVPCVGLWGPIDPSRRVCYYKNHLALYHREFCQQSPCFAYSNIFPRYCPPRNQRNVCEVMAGISPAEVIDAVQQALRIERQPIYGG